MKEVPIRQTDKVALVDDSDEAIVASQVWYMSGDGSAAASGLGMHRLIMKPPEGYDVSHRDRNYLNNQRANLYLVPRAVNAHRARRRFDNKSGYKGVTFDRQRYTQKKAPWRAQLKQGAVKHVSKWQWTSHEAARWYNAKAHEIYGDLAYQNEIQDEIEDHGLIPANYERASTTG